MSVLNQSGEEQLECPLCMEPLEIDDINFHPCTCGYQICRFCWHRIRTDENGLCPACRRAYSEDPANFRPLTSTEVQRLKSEKRMREQQRKQKVIESRQHLAAVRVVQKNLVFVLGLPARLTDTEVLKRHEYFGKFGRIQKVVINQSTSYAGTQGPSASAYVTYYRSEDALRAISAVNNTLVDSRSLKVSLGTTKYCSNFLKNQQCPRAECMYLHDLGDSEASFTKEDMQQGKHQEYEKKLYDQLLINSSSNQVKESISDNTPKATTTAPAASAWGNNSTEEPWPLFNDEAEENIASNQETKKKESEEPAKARRKRKGRSRGKHGSKKQVPESSSGRELSPSPPPQNNNSTGQDIETINGNVQLIPQSLSTSSSTSSISDDANGKEDFKVEATQPIPESAPTEFSHFPIDGNHLESISLQAAFGFEPTELPNGCPPGALDEGDDDDDDDDDLGFDPFAETQKGLAELIESEKQKQQQHQLQQSRSMTAIMQQQTNNNLEQLFRSGDLHRPTSHHDLPFEFDARRAPPPGFNGLAAPSNRPAMQPRAFNDMSQPASFIFGRVIDKEPNPPAPSGFSFANWQALLPNLGSSYTSNGAQRPAPMQQRPVQSDWTAMDPAIMAASARPRPESSNLRDQLNIMTTERLYLSDRSRTNLDWSGKLAPPPGFTRRY
ncbi:CCR4-NOT transcription complex subunit 4-like isoform X1 [Cloeon dipterum]|uniref:CCR4-NOT transcription complex subunit 4-like isoform X1 n=1 Tax=Cloeon dipterum TaxID=197152 RepID=UPI0032207880